MASHKPRNVTLKDVAKRVGVSAMTVSRALSDKSHLVSSETAELCRKVATEMGYVPNLMARSLRGEQLHTIVMFAEFISSHHYLAELVDVVSQSIEKRKYGVISCQSLHSLHQALKNFNLGGALIIAPPESFYADPFGERSIGPIKAPATVLIHSAVEQTDFSEVSPDIPGFTNRAVTHLLELGHRLIGYVGGPRHEDEPHWFDLRKKGIVQALAQHKLSPASLVHQPCPEPEMGPVAIQQLLKKHRDVTAIMCINDEVAVACIRGAESLGLRVPQDFSVVGCNDIRLARFFRPPLTTLAIDIPAMVDTALDLLMEQIQSRDTTEPIKILLPASLIVRESTAPPPQR